MLVFQRSHSYQLEFLASPVENANYLVKRCKQYLNAPIERMSSNQLHTQYHFHISNQMLVLFLDVLSRPLSIHILQYQVQLEQIDV